MRNFHQWPFTEPEAVDAEPVVRVPEDQSTPGHLIQQFPSGAIMSAMYPDYTDDSDDGMVSLYKGGSDPRLHAAGR